MAQDFIARNRLRTRLDAALAALPQPAETPTMVVDLDAFDANAADLVRRAGGTPIRVASKSLRVPALLERALATDGFSGVLAYCLREALWLHGQGVTDDILVGYPSVDRTALARLVSSPAAAATVTLMIDNLEHLDLVDSVRVSKGVPVRVAIDVDAGLRVAGKHIGPKRAPLMDATQVVARIKATSVEQLRERRHEIDRDLRKVASLQFWNAGGSGSLESSAADPVVTEVSAGSGLLVPGLFDHYQAFRPRPAAYFEVPVVRRPSPSMVTVAGGGFVASGPAGEDRLPLPWAPPGLHLTGLEGAGEAQTPLAGNPAGMLRIGAVVDTVPTYRGLGEAFG
jgi:D-serine deaminase-like pyridoxal phosphate-dependent protein